MKLPSIYLWIFIIVGIFCTFLRVSLLLFYPLFIILLFLVFRLKISFSAVFLLGLLFFLWILSFRNGFYIKYNLVSFYYYIPFLLLAFSLTPKRQTKWDYLRLFMIALTVVAIINNIAGIIQYCIRPNDDSFIGIYGRFTVTQNGLSIINTILFFYYLLLFQNTRRFIHLVLSGFFIFCSVLGFYGAGLMVLMLCLILFYMKINLKNIFSLFFGIIITGLLIILIMRIISPLTLEYNYNIINKFVHASAENAPRKLTIFYNYITGYFSHPVDLFLGSGPGTFNSRSAFMVGSPTYFNVEFIKSANQPYFFQKYAYTLWNASNTGPYDGFMNQPFSSLLSFLGEYGLIFTGFVFGSLFRKFKYINGIARADKGKGNENIAGRFYRFLSIFCFLLIIIDNYIEYPEITILLVIIIKLCEDQVLSYRKPPSFN